MQSRPVTSAQRRRAGISAGYCARRGIVVVSPDPTQRVGPLTEEAIGIVLVRILVSQPIGESRDLAGCGEGRGGGVAGGALDAGQIAGRVVEKGPAIPARIDDMGEEAGGIVIRLPAAVGGVGDGGQ